MITKVGKVIIGKYIERTAEIVDGASLTVATVNMADGEVAILDKDFNVIEGASATFANTDTIYIAEGSVETFIASNPDGSSLTGRRLLISNPIDGKRVVNYTGGAYSAKSEATISLPAISDTIVTGTEYVLRIVYRGDVAEQHPGQSTETYRYVAKTGDTSSDVYDALVKRINKRYTTLTIKKNKSKLVNAVNNAGVLEITALPIASCTTSVNDIDSFVMNNFSAFLNYVDNDGFQDKVTLASDATYTPADRGYGTWELVRDAEKHAMSYEGITNLTWFPIIKPDMRVIKGASYNMINIEHDRAYRSPDNQYNKETSLAEYVALQTGSGATTPQDAEVLATLNTWMASLPTPFSAVSFA